MSVCVRSGRSSADLRRAWLNLAEEKILQPIDDLRRADFLLPIWSRAPSRSRLALLWQIYSRCFSLQIHFLQCGHRCGGSRAMSSTMAWRTAGNVG
jgi:hypothetical protein